MMRRADSLAPLPVWALVLPVLAVFCAGAACQVLEPYQVAQTVEQRAGVVLGDFEIFQLAALSLSSNAEIEVNLRLQIIHAARVAKPVVDELDRGLRRYQKARARQLAGEGDEAQSQLAAQAVEERIAQALPLMAALKAQVRRAKP